MHILLLALLAQMPDLTGVTIRTEHVGGNVYMLEASIAACGERLVLKDLLPQE